MGDASLTTLSYLLPHVVTTLSRGTDLATRSDTMIHCRSAGRSAAGVLLTCATTIVMACATTRTAPPSTSTTAVTAAARAPISARDSAFLDTLQRRTFAYFWETANPRNGLVPDRWPTPSFSSVAAVGFALTAYPVGVEHGWIPRDSARDRVLTTLRFFLDAPQGTASSGETGYRGFYYHFLDMQAGRRFEHVELSTIDTGILLAGALVCQQYFDGADPRDSTIRALADSLYRRVDWQWARDGGETLSMGWRPDPAPYSNERGFITTRWRGYDEGMILYVLALGSPTHAINPAAWDEWTSTYRWDRFEGQDFLQFPPLFGHQYSHVWIDFRGIRDAYMRGKGIDYFENSRRAVLSQRQYAIDDSAKWRGYGANAWGLSASDGPLDSTLVIDGVTREFHTYWARGVASGEIRDDGTLVPTAVGGSIPFAPEVTIPTLRAMRERYGDALFSRYGFVDAFNPTLREPGPPLHHGYIVPGTAWFDHDYLGIDEGPIVAMLENYRTELVWKLMRKNPYVVRGLCRAGFTGGWLANRCGATAQRDRADSLLALMTLDEKIGQLTQTTSGWQQTGPEMPPVTSAQVRDGQLGSMLNYWGAERTRHMQHLAVDSSRLHIPLLFAQDVIHGWRTIFPVPLASAGTFDSAGVANAARIAATEATSQGIMWTFAPMVDIARDPRWGRIVEGAGEDPYLGSVMAAAQVRGFQGDSLGSATSLMGTAKHFVAGGAAEGGRDYNVADVSERTLWNVYLPPFHAAARAGVGSIMASFNEVDGTPAHADRWLLTDVLRDRWKYDGIVVSDWGGVEELMAHGIAPTRAEAAARAMNAGVDVEMASDLYRTDLRGLVKSGRVPVAEIDSAVLRVLRTKEKLGLFRDPYRYADTLREQRELLTPGHRAAARALAREAIVLLTNRPRGGAPALPLRTGLRSVAVIGPLADDAHSAIGPWGGAGRDSETVTPLAGLRAALPHARVTYVQGAPADTITTRGFAAAERAARDADAVILVLGEREAMSGEASSRANIGLPGAQLALAQAVVRAAHSSNRAKPVIAVLMNGRPLAVPWLADSADALVESWFLGTEHGNALADVLLGAYNPSGRLAVTVPRSVGQIPIHYDHTSTGRPPTDSEKYTSKYLDEPWTPLFPFGYGLSYTTFAYGTPRVSAATVRNGDGVTVTADVRNTGKRAGDEVVQLYVRDDAASVTRPVRMLRGFTRVTLAPGASRTISFSLTPEDLALYDLDMRRVVEPGTFTVWVGGSSLATAEAHFAITGDTLVLAPAPPRVR